jgi:hypothetical protein
VTRRVPWCSKGITTGVVPTALPSTRTAAPEGLERTVSVRVGVQAASRVSAAGRPDLSNALRSVAQVEGQLLERGTPR